jgi:hypothetical protein
MCRARCPGGERYHVGAWLQNVSHKDGKVTGDMYVNRQYAESSEKGKRLINAWMR